MRNVISLGTLVLAIACNHTADSPPSSTPSRSTSGVPVAGSGVSSDYVEHNASPLGNSRIVTAAPNTVLPPDRTIATDPDHDTIWITYKDGSPTQQIELGVGDEPGDIQLASNSAGDTIAYVSVHNGGAVVAIPLSDDTTAPLSFTSLRVCDAPRGMDAYPMPSGETLFVACADGVLVSVDVTTNTLLSTLPVMDDLKDVVVIDGVDALVTRFRTAQVLVVNLASGAVVPASLPAFSSTGDAGVAFNMTPDVAWQMIPIGGIPRQGAVIAHQLSETNAIVVTPPPGGDVDDGGGGGSFGATDGGGGGGGGASCGQSGYGPSSCGGGADGGEPSGPGARCGSGVVASAASLVTLPRDDQSPVVVPLVVPSPMIPPLTIVNLSVNGAPPPGLPPGSAVLMIGLGNGMASTIQFDPTAPSAQYQCGESAQQLPNGVVAINVDAVQPGILSMFVPQQGPAGAQVQTRQVIGTPTGLVFEGSPLEPVLLPFEAIQGETGRDLFHEGTPSLMSCASCHPNGRDDSHVWNFVPMGLRRTPSLGGGLLATAPFHWDGSELDITQLMTDVFVGRMDGQQPTTAQVTEISDWLNGLPEAHAAAAADTNAVAAGQVLFESPAVGCIACHTGEHFTNNMTLDVGTGGAFQVPSLRGVGSRPPYLHDGRAATLEDRFDPNLGGGDSHGHTSQLSVAQIEDLVAYLRSL